MTLSLTSESKNCFTMTIVWSTFSAEPCDCRNEYGGRTSGAGACAPRAKKSNGTENAVLLPVDSGDFDVYRWRCVPVGCAMITPVWVRPIAVTRVLIYRVGWRQGRPKSVAVLRARPVADATAATVVASSPCVPHGQQAVSNLNPREIGSSTRAVESNFMRKLVLSFIKICYVFDLRK